MLEEEALVVAVSEEGARVSLVRRDACSGCSARGVCHPVGGASMEMEVDNPVGARPGDRVVVTLPPEALLKATSTVYLFPAVALVVGAALGWSRLGGDRGALLGAAAGLLLSLGVLLLKGRRSADRERPAITRLLEGTGGSSRP